MTLTRTDALTRDEELDELKTELAQAKAELRLRERNLQRTYADDYRAECVADTRDLLQETRSRLDVALADNARLEAANQRLAQTVYEREDAILHRELEARKVPPLSLVFW